MMRRIRAEVERNRPDAEPPTPRVNLAEPPPESTPEQPGQAHVAAPAQDRETSPVDSGPAARVEDLLGLDGGAFLEGAYQTVLGRRLDDSGRERFLGALQSGRMGKAELLARLRLSSEGRKRGAPVGTRVLMRGIARAAFNVPVLGYVLASLNYAAKLPVMARNLEAAQAGARLARTEMANELASVEAGLRQRLVQSEAQLVDDLWKGLNLKVDKEPFWALSGDKIGHDEVRELLAMKLDTAAAEGFLSTAREIAGLQDTLVAQLNAVESLRRWEQKVDAPELWKRLNEKVDHAQLRRILERKVDNDVHERDLARVSETLGKGIDSKLDVDVYDARESQLLKRVARAVSAEEVGEGSGDVYWQALVSKVDKEWIFARQAETREAISAIEAVQGRLLRDLGAQKNTLLDQHRRVDLLLRELRARASESLSGVPLAAMASVENHWLDAHYLCFEDAFRGSREDIKARAEVYLPIIHAADAGSADRRVIDIGCGRGELLELLKDHGLEAQGIDQNHHLVEQCLAGGLNVAEADALDFLMDLPEGSVGAITGLHIIEHIPFERVVRLLDESLRVLQPGGVVVFETPNPENLIVGACTFWYDPTHLHPLPPNVSRFLLEARGFASVEIKRLAENRIIEALAEVPSSEPNSEHMNRIVSFINRHFAAEPDYAVIGYKA